MHQHWVKDAKAGAGSSPRLVNVGVDHFTSALVDMLGYMDDVHGFSSRPTSAKVQGGLGSPHLVP